MLSDWKVCCGGISQRWVFTIMAFLALSIGNSIRVILSITITEMVPPVVKSMEQKNGTCIGFETQIAKNITGTLKNTATYYDWDEYTQGLILSSYFWGYAATQIPFGTLSERFGGKYLLGFGIFVPSLLTFLVPPAVIWGDSLALIVLRVFVGVSSGSMFPAASTLVSRWTTPADRTRCCTIVFAGAVSGTIVGTVIPAVIIRYTDLGWQGVFYIFGASGIVWFPIWLLLCYDNPQSHPFISDAEFKILDEFARKSNKKLPAAPWKRILTSPSAWAFIIALFGLDWAYFTVASDLPKYMSDVVKLSIEDNGYLSSLPHFGEWIFSGVSVWIVNGILKKEWMSTTNARKLFTTISCLGTAGFIVAASYAECNQALVVVLFFSAMALMGCSYPGIMVNALDLSPNYSGTLWAIGNALAALGGMFTPYIVGILTPNQTISEWRLVFWIVFGICVASNVFFLVYGSAEVQDWNDVDGGDSNNRDVEVNTISDKVTEQKTV